MGDKNGRGRYFSAKSCNYSLIINYFLQEYQGIINQNYHLTINNNNGYSPENNTAQNIEIYKQKQLQQKANMNMINPQILYSEQNPTYDFQTPINNYNSFPENYLLTPIQNQNIINQNNNINDNLEKFSNNNNINIINNIKNDNKNNKNEKENENKEEEFIDPDEAYFEKEEKKNEDKKEEDDENGELSSDSDKNSNNEKDYTDHLLAQYNKVKRIRNRWKVVFKGCVIQKDKKEYICSKLTGDLEREW